MKTKNGFSILKWFKLSAIIIVLFSCLGCDKFIRPEVLTMSMGLGMQEWNVFRTEIFPRFEKKYHVKINAYYIHSEELAIKLEAQEVALDLFSQDNMSLAMLIDKGLVLDLSGEAGSIPEQVLPNLITCCRFDHKLMFMPFRPNVQIIYYNSEIFNKYNLEPPKTWDELLTVAKKLKKLEGTGRVLLKAFGGADTATQVYELVLQAGGNPFTFDDEGCVAAFEFLQELWPYLSEESLRAKWDTTGEILARQEAYLGQNWPLDIIPLCKDNALPFIKTYSGWAGPVGEYHVVGGEVFGIPKNSRNKALAMKFIRYVYSKEVQGILVSQLGWPSVRNDVYDQVEPWQRPHAEVVQEALSHGVFRENVTWWLVYEKYVSEAFREIVIEKAPVRETLKKYKEKLLLINIRLKRR